jgi:peptidoglycan/xylan/chitin deacetylase (PgdA/CDA1 family)
VTGILAASAASVFPLRRRLTPRCLPAALSGLSDRHHVALTFDDGPDPHSTPHFLDLLARHDVRATFFLLGRYAALEPGLVRRIAAEGHELGVHGWDHRAVARLPRARLRSDLRITRDLLSNLAGEPVRWYRPPYGISTRTALAAATDAHLTPVLWSAWGRDWERGATPDRVRRTLHRTLAPGGTVLLHDTDRTSAPGSWRTTLVATEHLLEECEAPLGPLAEHGLLTAVPA